MKRTMCWGGSPFTASGAAPGGRGSRMSALLWAIVIALPVYYPLLLWGESLARSGALPPPLAVNLSNLLLGAAGLWRLGRTVG